MKMLTTFLLLCAGMALTNAAAVPEAEPDQMTGEEHIQEEELLLNLTVPEAELHEEMNEEEHIQEDAALLFSGRCPFGWEHFNDHCFIYIGAPMPWALAERHCQALGGNLASVHSPAEVFFIKGVIHAATNAFPVTWIGASDAQREDIWLWSDGSFFDFNKWCPGQPNNHNGREHCTVMNSGGGRCWNDISCDSYYSFVCAKRV